MNQLSKMRVNSFPEATIQDWTEQAEKALKGKPVEKLSTHTYEGITRKPVYTDTDLEELQSVNTVPGSFPFIRGSQPVQSQKANWTVSQQLSPLETFAQLNHQLQHELKNGLEAINFSIYPASCHRALPIRKSSDIDTLLTNLPLDTVPVQIYAGTSLSTFLQLLKNSTISSLKGIIGVDPIGELVKEGKLTATLNDLYDELKSNLDWKREHLPEVKTLWVQATPYHNSGASAVEELAVTMATATEYLQALVERGVPIQEAASEFAFTYPVGSDFFMEIAKLRAARLLWANIVEAFGGDEHVQKMTIHGTTSPFTKSELDVHVNMLRTTTEAFSAVIGGVQSLNVDSFQSEADTFSRRIARNTHYILKEESFLSHVVDPAAGSYYVESLTHQLADDAWKLFQGIDEAGGIVEALKAGFLQERIAKVRTKRLQDIEGRKKVLVGTNMYANLAEKLEKMSHSNVQTESGSEAGVTMTITPLKPITLAQPYEQLRFQAKQFEENTAKKPTISMINLGTLAAHKPRTDFASGYFHVGGLFTIGSPSFTNVEEFQAWLSTNLKTNYVCICGNDDSYSTMLDDVLMTIKRNSPHTNILLAGLPDQQRKEELLSLGVTDFIHLKSNCYEQLSAIHQEMGLTLNEA
ncbi:methylmalonyl-CoA mutase subunit beta [Sutcliffiella halmapala]|uniref:methylmalonyl-CoA mutase subunit beta n=1 Tax=Sutcliffiella halmapala TaxID=79882 RepID=UPI00147636EA|nr:methylmalonyl-CoA mutase subunit beta [Sutcliffiella halmapala]